MSDPTPIVLTRGDTKLMIAALNLTLCAMSEPDAAGAMLDVVKANAKGDHYEAAREALAYLYSTQGESQNFERYKRNHARLQEILLGTIEALLT